MAFSKIFQFTAMVEQETFGREFLVRFLNMQWRASLIEERKSRIGVGEVEWREWQWRTTTRMAKRGLLEWVHLIGLPLDLWGIENFHRIV